MKIPNQAWVIGHYGLPLVAMHVLGNVPLVLFLMLSNETG
jgi:hypothetical protein